VLRNGHLRDLHVNKSMKLEGNMYTKIPTLKYKLYSTVLGYRPGYSEESIKGTVFLKMFSKKLDKHTIATKFRSYRTRQFVHWCTSNKISEKLVASA
jgi:hypothetical protein